MFITDIRKEFYDVVVNQVRTSDVGFTFLTNALSNRRGGEI